MKLLIVTQWLENYRELTDITSPLKKDYATRWGYDFFEQIGNYNNWGFDYQRIQLLYDILFKSILNKEYDYVWYLGSDAAPVNHTKNVAEFLTDTTRHCWLVKDVNGINTDSFILRKSEWTKKWLEFVIAKEPQYKNDCWESQRCFQNHIETDEWRSGVCVLSHPSINSYDYTRYQWPTTTPGHISKGDMVFHAPGMNLRERLDLFRSDWFNNLIIK